jgi:hypothetical protein
MDVNTFANYLLALLIALQLIGAIVFLLLFHHVGPKSIPLSIILMFLINSVALYYIQKVKVYDKDGKVVEKPADILGDVIAVTVWSTISALIITIIAIVFAWRSATVKGRNHGLAFLVPILSIATFYGSLVFVNKAL